MLEKKNVCREKGIQIRGERVTRKGCQNRGKSGEKGIQIAMIRVLAMRSNQERVGNLRQRVH